MVSVGPTPGQRLALYTEGKLTSRSSQQRLSCVEYPSRYVGFDRGGSKSAVFCADRVEQSSASEISERQSDLAMVRVGQPKLRR